MENEGAVSLVLFSGTDDKLNAAAVLTAGAAAMGRKVNIFLQYWALDAFRADRIMKDHGVAPEAGGGAPAPCAARGGHWSEVLRQAKDLGGCRSTRARSRWRCSGSRGTTSIRSSTTEGVASFFMDVDGPVTVHLKEVGR